MNDERGTMNEEPLSFTSSFIVPRSSFILSPVSAFRRFNHQNRILGLALLAGLPASVIALALLWGGGFSPKVCWTLSALILCSWLGCALALREQVTRPLQTISNLLAALREGDYFAVPKVVE